MILQLRNTSYIFLITVNTLWTCTFICSEHKCVGVEAHILIHSCDTYAQMFISNDKYLYLLICICTSWDNVHIIYGCMLRGCSILLQFCIQNDYFQLSVFKINKIEKYSVQMQLPTSHIAICNKREDILKTYLKNSFLFKKQYVHTDVAWYSVFYTI